MQLLKKPKRTEAKRKVNNASLDIKALLLPLELRLVLEGATVKFEHHPMEVGPHPISPNLTPSHPFMATACTRTMYSAWLPYRDKLIQRGITTTEWYYYYYNVKSTSTNASFEKSHSVEAHQVIVEMISSNLR